MTFEAGLAHHQAGRLHEAEMIYRGVLAADRQHAGAWFHLGTIALQTGHAAGAVPLLEQAAQLDPERPECWFHLAQARSQKGDLAPAAEAYRAALRLQPGYAEAWGNLCHVLQVLGEDKEAAGAGAEAVRLQPEVPEARFNLAFVLLKLGRAPEARAHLEAALRYRPAFSDALNLCGKIRYDDGDLAGAVGYFEKAVASEPDFVAALGNLGSALFHLDRLAEAEGPLRSAARLAPNDVGLQTQLGAFLVETEQWAEAHAILTHALRLRPADDAACHVFALWHNRQGRYAEALPWYTRALAAKPDQPVYHWNRAVLRLLGGDYAAGWPEYEWRWLCPAGLKLQRTFPEPRWQGEELAGRTLLLHAEQGLGDALQMARYLSLAAARGGRVLVESPAALEPLFRPLPGVAGWIRHGEPLPPFDLHCPLMSLPLAFGTRSGNIPAPERYLAAPAEKAARWRAEIGARPGRKIGLVWGGSALHLQDQIRSVPLWLFGPLLEEPGHAWFSLQKGPPAAQAAAFSRIADHTAELHDFGDTAALIEILDLVIAVDTAVAHLAAALGKPVWLLLPFVPDWRWGAEGERTPWYPTMRLLRQRTPRDWMEVMARVHAALKEATA